MSVWEFSLGVFLGSTLAGFLGALTGLGGGVVLVPLLVLVFRVDLHHALGASLVSVIATSSGAAAAYVREGYTNLRLGMFLELATTLGALLGAGLLGVLPKRLVALVFGLVLLHSAYLSYQGRLEDQPIDPKDSDPLAKRLRLEGGLPSPEGERAYGVRCLLAGLGLMGLAGVLSGLLGIGSGAVKVLAMDRVMGLPYKVSTTTSNFMIGVTAAASAGIYLRQGYIDPRVSFPVMLGVLLGAFLGARILPRSSTSWLRTLFTLVIAALGLQMVAQGVGK
ncbi:sulfite exporter TauE/SafE family protein [Thermus sp. PS18]|uniref:sulfite exporter TauE/SafE family protein n=1 Tax=Thermus sp. PS18 TaxID=2849039 RepID=UPI002264F157|nr:sulfite exporter TauE/SafE family protein [Thermus sp. PS18]UZX14689.1 sulfite exporter TauE/SafE family protein [Thermus sp. PS18]